MLEENSRQAISEKNEKLYEASLVVAVHSQTANTNLLDIINFNILLTIEFSPFQHTAAFLAPFILICYQQIVPSTETTVTHDEVYNAAKVSWTDAVAKAKAAKKPSASIGCALFIPGKGWILDTSLKAVGSNTQSAQTCDVVTDFSHINKANCAEMNALAIMLDQGWAEPTQGAVMACYGDYGKPETVKPKWVNPCRAAVSKVDQQLYPGCKETLMNNPKWQHITVLPAKADS